MQPARQIDQLAAIPTLLLLRFEVREAARILRISRALLYKRISDGAIKPQKDGARTYITSAELERYVRSCDDDAHSTLTRVSDTARHHGRTSSSECGAC